MKANRLTRWTALLLCGLMFFGGCSGIHPKTPQEQSGIGKGSEPVTATEIPSVSGTDAESVGPSGPAIHPDDVMVLTAADLRADKEHEAAVTVDIVCQLTAEKMTAARIRSQITDIRNLGITRVYLILCSPGYPLMSGGEITATNPGLTSSRLTESLRALDGDPNRIYIETCHALGMEAIAVIKPYEGGGGVSVPAGRSIAGTVSGFGNAAQTVTVGGERVFFDDFIAEHPELRVRRRADGAASVSAAVTSMEWYWYGDGVPSSVTQLNASAVNRPALWVSTDNGSYRLYEDFTYRYDLVTNFPITDPNGETVMTRTCLRLTLTISGLTEDEKYLACSLRDDSAIMKNALYTRPYSMARLYRGEEQLPSTLGYYVRKPYSADATPETFAYGAYTAPVSGTVLSGVRVENGKAVGVYPQGSDASGAEAFTEWGFEFEYVYTSAVNNGMKFPLIALAVGKNEYVQGLLCEGYSEVRDYWLSQVETALAYGADGIDIRPDGHSSMVSDWYYYGYNEPIAEEYLRRYGTELASEPVNATTARRIMEIRGDFYTRFLEQAAELTHNAGKLFLAHFFATSFSGAEGTPLPMGQNANEAAQWKMPKILLNDYKKIVDFCDEIVYKDYFSQYYAAGDWAVGERLTSYIRSTGKPVWIHCYVQQSPQQLNAHFFENFAQSGMYGVTLYEIVPSFDYTAASGQLAAIRDPIPWRISILGRISGIAAGTTARELIAMLGMIGSNAVVDPDGNSVPLDTVLTGEHRLCLNQTTMLPLQISPAD